MTTKNLKFTKVIRNVVETCNAKQMESWKNAVKLIEALDKSVDTLKEKLQSQEIALKEALTVQSKQQGSIEILKTKLENAEIRFLKNE